MEYQANRSKHKGLMWPQRLFMKSAHNTIWKMLFAIGFDQAFCNEFGVQSRTEYEDNMGLGHRKASVGGDGQVMARESGGLEEGLVRIEIDHMGCNRLDGANSTWPLHALTHKRLDPLRVTEKSWLGYIEHQPFPEDCQKTDKYALTSSVCKPVPGGLYVVPYKRKVTLTKQREGHMCCIVRECPNTVKASGNHKHGVCGMCRRSGKARNTAEGKANGLTSSDKKEPWEYIDMRIMSQINREVAVNEECSVWCIPIA